jgi:hypothetical protein
MIDVSEPSENLLWEIDELSDGSGRKCVFIGQYDRVLPLASRSPPSGPFGARLSALLDGEEVLAYTTDRRGARRFARALKARLENRGDRDGD